MTPLRDGAALRVGGRGGEGGGFHLGEDGEIKGPGPFGSLALMVLKNFRDLAGEAGPGIVGLSRLIKGLSGTPRSKRLQ